MLLNDQLKSALLNSAWKLCQEVLPNSPIYVQGDVQVWLPTKECLSVQMDQWYPKNPSSATTDADGNQTVPKVIKVEPLEEVEEEDDESIINQDMCYCNICYRIFFDKDLLDDHMKTHEQVDDNASCSDEDSDVIDTNNDDDDSTDDEHDSSDPKPNLLQGSSSLQLETFAEELNKSIEEQTNREENDASKSSDILDKIDQEQVSYTSTNGPAVDFVDRFNDECEKLNIEDHDKVVLLKRRLRHLQHMENGRRVYKCVVCGKIKAVKKQFLEHMMTHLDLRPFKCSYCSKRFKRQEALSMHEYTHTNTAPHQCKLCGKRFPKTYLLQSHMYIHEGVVHKCDICSSEYTNFFTYRQHVRRHLNNTFRGFWCNYCQVHFATKPEFDAHDLTHFNSSLSVDGGAGDGATSVPNPSTTTPHPTYTPDLAKWKLPTDALVKPPWELNEKKETKTPSASSTKERAIQKETKEPVTPKVKRGPPLKRGRRTKRSPRKVQVPKTPTTPEVNPEQEDSGKRTRRSRKCTSYQVPSEDEDTVAEEGDEENFDENDAEEDEDDDDDDGGESDPNDKEYKSPLPKKQPARAVVKSPKERIKAEREMVAKRKRYVLFFNDGVKTYRCLDCDKVYTSFSAWRKHHLAHYHPRRFVCTTCGKKFNRKDTLQTHEFIHTKESPFKCTVCDKCFPKKYFLLDHMNSHTGLKPYQCQTCSKFFCSKISLNLHMRRHKIGKHIKCAYSECDKMFYTQHDADVHLRVHTNERPYECGVCKMRFKDSSTFRKHEKLHTVATFMCSFCSRMFHTAAACQRHEADHHINEGSYKCVICNKGFNTKAQLQRHNIVHTGERPYICKYCGKAFTQPNDCVRHERIHSGVKPYACTICDRTFTLKNTRDVHLKTHMKHQTQPQHTPPQAPPPPPAAPTEEDMYQYHSLTQSLMAFNPHPSVSLPQGPQVQEHPIPQAPQMNMAHGPQAMNMPHGNAWY